MRIIPTLSGLVLGAFVGMTMLVSVSNLLDIDLTVSSEEFEKNTNEHPETNAAPTKSKREFGATEKNDLFRLAYAMDIPAVNALVEDAHQKSLTGEISYDDLRQLYSVFESTAPEMRTFAETWVDEAPGSAYALAALATNLTTAGWNMRGSDTMQMTFMEAAIRFTNLIERAQELAERAYGIAPDLVPASDAVIKLVLNRPKGNPSPLNRAHMQARILKNVMAVTPNRGSLLRANIVSQTAWGGNFDGAIMLCSQFANMVTDVDGYSPEVCVVDAAYTYGYSDRINDAAREVLYQTDVPYLEYARLRELKPGLSRVTDEKILAYLNEEGTTDLKLANAYDMKVARQTGLPLVSKKVFENMRNQTLEMLKTDPYNPALISKLTVTAYGSGPDSYADDRTEDIALSKRAMVAAPFDPVYWSKTAVLYHATHDAADPNENPYFINSIVYSNNSPSYFFEFLRAKEQDYDVIKDRIDAGELAPDQLLAADDAVTCPLIRLARMREMFCGATTKAEAGYFHSDCKNFPDEAAKLQDIISAAKSRKACTAEITDELGELFYLGPSETSVVTPVKLGHEYK